MDLKQMKARCSGAEVRCVGKLPRYRLDFTKDAAGWDGGVADIVSDNSAQVWGVIYTITPDDLKALDEYEDYPKAYTRFQTTIETDKGPINGVWVYSVVNKVGFLAPARFYMSWIKKAALHYNFPPEYHLYLDSIPLK